MKSVAHAKRIVENKDFGPRALALATLIVRIFLFRAIREFINKALNKTHAIQGNLEDIRFNIREGDFTVKGLTVAKTTSPAQPVLSVESIDLWTDWKQLLKWSLVGEFLVKKPILTLFLDLSKRKERRTPKNRRAKPKAEVGWQETARSLFPAKIHQLQIKDGTLHAMIRQNGLKTNIDMEDIQVVARNLTNSHRLSQTLMATVDGQGSLMGRGKFKFNLEVNPLEEEPTFNLDLTVKGVPLPDFNPLLRHYLGIDVDAGTLDCYVEAIAEKGEFKGYAKPFIKDLNVLNRSKERLPFKRAMKEGMADVLAKMLENRGQEAISTKIEFSGTFQDPKIDTWSAIKYLMKNALVKGLEPKI